MRAANSYEELDQTHEQVAAGQEPTPIPEQEKPELDQEITPEQGTDSQADIDRALALESEGEPAPEPSREPSIEDPVTPERWAHSGGMVEQQASAMEWLEHSDEVRGERAAKQEFETAGQELTSDDRELLEAARATDAQAQQQDLAQSQIHEPSGP
jgi:hypothetical protein